MSYRDFPSKSRLKFAYWSQLATVQPISHTLIGLSCKYYLIMSATVKTYLHWNCQPYFAVFLSIIFRYTAGTHVSSVVVFFYFTSKSSDYVLSKAGLFSTKLSLSIIAKLNYFTRYNNAMNQQYTKLPFCISGSRNHAIDFCACVSGLTLRMQSANILAYGLYTRSAKHQIYWHGRTYAQINTHKGIQIQLQNKHVVSSLVNAIQHR